jgi:DNA-binding NtrC family response regulator
LEKREIRRVGSNDSRTIDVRVLAATNRRLENEVNAGRFREDLFFRLSVVHVELPPLRRRKDDIPLLSEHFLRKFGGPSARGQVADFDEAIEAFYRHTWPGNVRELRNLVEIACAGERRPISLNTFLYLEDQADESGGFAHLMHLPFKDAKQELVGRFEREYIREILRKHNGNISRASRAADIERAYLQRLIKKHGFE